jgi:uncharacterized membrane protein
MKRSMRTRQYTPIASARLEQTTPPADEDVTYIDYSQTGFEEPESSDVNEELDDTHRFRMAIGVFNLISILAGLAFILVMVALLISLITWLQGDISQSLTLLTSNLQ